MVLRRNPISGVYYESERPNILPFHKMTASEKSLWGKVGLASTIGGLSGAVLYGLTGTTAAKAAATCTTSATGTTAAATTGGTVATGAALTAVPLSMLGMAAIPLATTGIKAAAGLTALTWLEKNKWLVLALFGGFIALKYVGGKK